MTLQQFAIAAQTQSPSFVQRIIADFFTFENAVTLAIVQGVIVMTILLGLTGWIVLAERKVIAWLQWRSGPNRAGPLGLLHPLADVLKLLTKEESHPPFVDKFLFVLAPMIISITTLLSFAVVPIWDSKYFVISDLNVGVLLILAMSSLGVYSIVLAGWSSNSKYAILGGLRATAQMISYELALSIAALGVVLQAGSLNLTDIVRAQDPFWFVLLQPLGFVVFFIAMIAEARRTPFDLPEAENEIIAGFHTEYSSMKFALFFLGEYIGMTLLSFLISVFYLGGWYGPIASGPWWLIGKALFFMFIFIWIRATLPRFRYDHLMEFGWRFLIPLAVLNLVLTAILTLAFPGLVPNAVQ